jgi:hypothetical protein
LSNPVGWLSPISTSIEAARTASKGRVHWSIFAMCCRDGTAWGEVACYGAGKASRPGALWATHMGNAYRSRWLLLLAGLGVMTGCAQSTDRGPFASYEPDPRVIAGTHALGADWARMARLAEVNPSQTIARAPTSGQLVRAPTAKAPERQRVASPSVGDAVAGPPPRRNLWDKQPWEVELDKTVRGICRGC